MSSYVDSESLPWRPTPHAGVEWKKLFFEPETGESAVLLRFAPGASYGAHEHPGGEEYFVLSGTLREGDAVYEAGTYARHPSGSRHRPRSDDGCIVFVRLPLPIEEL